MAGLIRFVKQEDIPCLLEIYAPYITETTFSFEYVPPTLEEFTARVNTFGSKYPYLVYEESGKVLGYAYASPYGVRKAFEYSVDLSIYIDMNSRAQGIGTALYEAIFDILQKQGFYNMYVCITELNTNSLAFHEKIGFRHLGAHKKIGYKFGQWLDLVWMDKQLPQPSPTPRPLRSISEFDNTDLLQPSL